MRQTGVFLLICAAASLHAQAPRPAEPLGFPPRDSTTTCKLKRTKDLPVGATQAHWFWVGGALPTVQVNGRVIGTRPPDRQIWVAYDRTGVPIVLADSVSDQTGMTIARVEFGPGPSSHGFVQREEIDTALVRRLMNDSGNRSLLEAVDSVRRAMKKGPRVLLDSVVLHRAREISEFLWARRCTTGVRS